jgi:hypothetical protein
MPLRYHFICFAVGTLGRSARAIPRQARWCKRLLSRVHRPYDRRAARNRADCEDPRRDLAPRRGAPRPARQAGLRMGETVVVLDGAGWQQTGGRPRVPGRIRSTATWAWA